MQDFTEILENRTTLFSYHGRLQRTGSRPATAMTALLSRKVPTQTHGQGGREGGTGERDGL